MSVLAHPWSSHRFPSVSSLGNRPDTPPGARDLLAQMVASVRMVEDEKLVDIRRAHAHAAMQQCSLKFRSTTPGPVKERVPFGLVDVVSIKYHQVYQYMTVYVE